MTSVDLRGFAYALEPLRQQRQWQYDKSLMRLAELRGKVSLCEARREVLKAECIAQAAVASQAWNRRSDPTAQARLLVFLSNLHQQSVKLEREISDLMHLLDQARRACTMQQQKLEVLGQHRCDTLKTYISDQHRRSAIEADRDWAVRTGSDSAPDAAS